MLLKKVSGQVMFNIACCRLFMKMMQAVKVWVYFKKKKDAFGFRFRQGCYLS